MKKLDGKDLLKMTQETYGTPNVTREQMGYVLSMLTPTNYLLKHHTIKGHPITFDVPNRDTNNAHSHRPWQKKIINDSHPNKAVMKSRQLGLSEMGVGEMLHFADTYSAFSPKCLYTFPTDRAMKEFVQTRLDPILDNTPYFRGIVNKDKNSQKVKQIRNSTMFFRTSSTSRTVEGVDIDYLSLDEYDRVLDAAESSALEAMSSSKFGIVRRWSTPRAPETGIDRLFKKSDQHYYLHKCEHCNYWNQMNFEEYDSSSVEAGGNVLCVNPSGVDRLTGNVVDGSFQYVCQKCGKPLDRWYSGEWVAKFPDRTADGGGIRGYFISQMNAVWISADNLKRKELSTPSKQSFHNYVLGMPFADKSLMVVDDDVLENRSEDLPTQRHNRDGYRFISVGIDWGKEELPPSISNFTSKTLLKRGTLSA